MRQSRIRLGALAALIALFCGMVVERYLSAGLSFDSLLSLRHLAFGDRHAPEESRVVVVAIDEATFADPAFKDIPLGACLSSCLSDGGESDSLLWDKQEVSVHEQGLPPLED